MKVYKRENLHTAGSEIKSLQRILKTPWNKMRIRVRVECPSQEDCRRYKLSLNNSFEGNQVSIKNDQLYLYIKLIG